MLKGVLTKNVHYCHQQCFNRTNKALTRPKLPEEGAPYYLFQSQWKLRKTLLHYGDKPLPDTYFPWFLHAGVTNNKCVPSFMVSSVKLSWQDLSLTTGRNYLKIQSSN
jgi:hypothetical protein